MTGSIVLHFMLLAGVVAFLLWPRWLAPAHRIVKEIQAWGILATVMGIVVAVYQLTIERDVREATLFASASERLESARELDRHRRPSSQVGQVRVLEEMVQLGISLRALNAQGTSLVKAQLASSDLLEVTFQGADLTVADLSDADLRFADFRDAYLTLTTLVLDPEGRSPRIHIETRAPRTSQLPREGIVNSP